MFEKSIKNKFQSTDILRIQFKPDEKFRNPIHFYNLITIDVTNNIWSPWTQEWHVTTQFRAWGVAVERFRDDAVRMARPETFQCRSLSALPVLLTIGRYGPVCEVFSLNLTTGHCSLQCTTPSLLDCFTSSIDRHIISYCDVSLWLWQNPPLWWSRRWNVGLSSM